MTESRRRSGYLVLADISGYTAFLTGTELEHAQGIIEDLTRAILGSLTPPLTLVKLEGDAVFARSPGDRLSGDRILDLVERTYWDFADCREDMQRNTTCTCEACASIPTLDLKFLVHYGEYVTHAVGGSEDLAGPDVILVHRLLKNDVREATGCGAYAFITDAALVTMPGVMLPGHAEHTQEFGEVGGGVLDLGESLRRMREARSVFVEPGEADFEWTWHLPVSPAEAWDLWTNPGLARLWQSDVRSNHFERNRDGRQGVEAAMHCAHGGFDTQTRYLDWRPFAYYTASRDFSNSRFLSPPALTETLRFVPAADGGDGRGVPRAHAGPRAVDPAAEASRPPHSIQIVRGVRPQTARIAGRPGGCRARVCSGDSGGLDRARTPVGETAVFHRANHPRTIPHVPFGTGGLAALAVRVAPVLRWHTACHVGKPSPVRIPGARGH